MSPNRSNGSKWVQKSTNVPEQVQTGLNESKQFLMGQKSPNGFKCVLTDLNLNIGLSDYIGLSNLIRLIDFHHIFFFNIDIIE